MGVGKDLEHFEKLLLSILSPTTDGVYFLGHLSIPTSLYKNKNKIPIPLNTSVLKRKTDYVLRACANC